MNPLTGEHVLVSPHRTKRPWQGQTEPPQQANLPQYDPQCYLCPGNTRAGGQQNDKYEHTMVFEKVSQQFRALGHRDLAAYQRLICAEYPGSDPQDRYTPVDLTTIVINR